IYVMPFLMGVELLGVVNGPVLRKDWLDKLKLETPKTIADWEKVLTAFRDGDPNGNGKKDEIPLIFGVAPTTMADTEDNHFLVGVYGISNDFYRENGTVIYGPSRPQFKGYLATMAKWYRHGLIDKGYATTDGKLTDAKLTNHHLGANTGYEG